jgi:hypothetical protein
VIAQAAERYAKTLYTHRAGGGRPLLVPAADERWQGWFDRQRILELHEEGVPLAEIAVLFRSSFHSFDLELELARAGVPFVKRGGFRFIETAHVKDVLAHLRVIEVRGWARDMHWPATGLPFLPTSPAMPDYFTALVYPGTCLFEGTNLSEGGGTEAPFRTVAAPRVDVGAVAAPLITLVVDPSVPNAYGGFAFDYEGQPAHAITLIDDGRVVGMLPDRRRPGHVGAIEAMPSHLRLAAGTASAESLRGDGFLLEGGQHAVYDAGTDRVVIGAARARVLERGVDTGRVYANVGLVGNMSALLAGVTGVAKETSVLSFRDEIDGEPRWRSVEAPFMRTRGTVRMRRRA